MNIIDIKDLYGQLDGKFIMCKACNRPLIERLPNGLWRFKFGRPRMTDDVGRPLVEGNKPIFQNVIAPVILYVHGSLRMKCFRNKCNAWNELNYFPINESFSTIVSKKNHV